jgi:hypothetical protein
MKNLTIIGRRGSRSRKYISKEAGIPLYNGIAKSDIIINYGLAGKALESFFNRYKSSRNIPMINRFIGCSKYTAIKDAESEGILVPESRMSLGILSPTKGWIEKRIHSSQGIGIKAATRRSTIPGKYYQKMITDRKFELRVHAFLWLSESEWSMQKRVGPADQIAWNFHQGGRFITVKNPNGYAVFKNAKEIAKKILEVRHMAFGAVDLIVTNNMEVYFIEVNSSPGFTELSGPIYFSAMTALKSMPYKNVRKFAR